MPVMEHATFAPEQVLHFADLAMQRLSEAREEIDRIWKERELYRRKSDELAREVERKDRELTAATLHITRHSGRAAKLEESGPALRLAEVAKRETPDDVGELDLDGIYGRVVRGDRRPADALARSVAKARRALGKALAEIGVSTIVGTLVRIDGETAEVLSGGGERYALPAPPGFGDAYQTFCGT